MVVGRVFSKERREWRIFPEVDKNIFSGGGESGETTFFAENVTGKCQILIGRITWINMVHFVQIKNI